MRGGLAQVEQALERYGLLLEHDVELPSVTLIVAGEPIRGSWWGHTLGHTIYELTGKLQEGSGKLSTKIIDAKVTYVHPRLWPAFLTLAQHAAQVQLAALPPAARALYAYLEQHGPIRADALPPELRSMPRAPRELTKTIRALEGRLLLHADSLHTESGAHVKVLQTWSQWREQQQVRVPGVAIDAARAELERAVVALSEGSARKLKVPW